MGLAARKLEFTKAVKPVELTELDRLGVKRLQSYCSISQALTIDELLYALKVREVEHREVCYKPMFTHMDVDTFALWLVHIGYDDPNRDARYYYWIADLEEYLRGLK